MATIKGRIATPIRNPLTTANLRQAATRNKQIIMPFPGSNELINVGQQIGATVADPFGFKATVDGIQQSISAGAPGVILGGVILVIGLILIWSGIQVLVLPTAGKIAGAVAGAAG